MLEIEDPTKEPRFLVSHITTGLPEAKSPGIGYLQLFEALWYSLSLTIII